MLYVCPTPIGNLEDITLRVLRVLKEADLIIAEDTRQTRKLLTHYEITNQLMSFHLHNEYHKTDQIIELLQAGRDIALVSDAGMPGISDPGGELVRQVITNDLPVTVLPGANAAVTALVQSGLLADQFLFSGFLPRKKSQIEHELQKLQALACPIIFFEAPHRLLATLKVMLTVLGNRQCAVCRELTKRFEETKRGTLSEVIAYFTENNPRGEFVLVVEGRSTGQEQATSVQVNVKSHLRELIQGGMSKKVAIRTTAKLLGVPKNEVYQQALDLPEGVEKI